MNDLDQAIRQELSQLVDTAPMATPLRTIVAAGARDTRAGDRDDPSNRWLFSIAAAVVVCVGIAAWVVLDRTSDQVVAANDGAALLLGSPSELDLPESTNVELPLAIAGDGLIAGATVTTPLTTELGLVRIDDPSSDPREILSVSTEGLLTALEASDDTVVAVVSRHLTSQLPLVLFSTNGGETWSETELPLPDGWSIDDAAVSDAAIGNGRIVLAGGNGVWISIEGEDWKFVEVFAHDIEVAAHPGDSITEVVWSGQEFVIAGGVLDGSVPNGQDHDVAFWRSDDGRTWSGPDTLRVNPSIRTSGGADQIISDGQGRVLSLTATQRWVDGQPDATDRGTLVATSEADGDVSTTHLADWILYDAFAVDGGFLAAGVRESRPEDPRFLFTTNGISWNDIGPAPGLSSIGFQWGDHIVINGPRIESGNPNRTWVLPIGEPGTPLPPPTTTPDSTATTQLLPTAPTAELAAVDPSQQPAEANRDGVVAEVAALSFGARVDETQRVATDEGTWLISRLSPAVEQASDADGCRLGDTSGEFPADFICTYEYGEVLLLDAEGHIVRAFPMPGAPPDWIEVTDSSVYAGRIGDGGLPHSTLARIDRSTLEVVVVVFPTGLDDPVLQAWPPTWKFADGALIPRLDELLVTVGTPAFDADLADTLIDDVSN